MSRCKGNLNGTVNHKLGFVTVNTGVFEIEFLQFKVTYLFYFQAYNRVVDSEV